MNKKEKEPEPPSEVPAQDHPSDKNKQHLPNPTQTKTDQTKSNIPDEPKDAKIAELTELVKRVQAEFDNYRKRIEKERKDDKDFFTADTIKKLLPVLDSFELALKNKTKENAESFRGLELIYSQLISILEELGLKPIICHGLKFDHCFHEVMLTKPCDSDSDDDKIVAELQQGYVFKNRVIRCSRVQVLKKTD